MRTTLTLDPDVASLLRARMAERKSNMKQVVNDALRRGLAVSDVQRARKRIRVIGHSLGLRPGVDRDKMNQLVDEMEAQEFAAKQSVQRGWSSLTSTS